jgi:homoserine dehydrogenase
MTTHEGPARAVQAALDRLEGSPSLTGKPMWMPILDV